MPQAGLGQVTVRAQIQAMAVVSDVAPVRSSVTVTVG